MTLATLDCPIQSIREAPEHQVLITQFDNTTEQRRLKASRPRMVWTITTPVLHEAEMLALRDFYNARSGPLEAFHFLSPIDGSVRIARFMPNSFFVSDVGSLNWQIEFSLVTVRQ